MALVTLTTDFHLKDLPEDFSINITNDGLIIEQSFVFSTKVNSILNIFEEIQVNDEFLPLLALPAPK